MEREFDLALRDLYARLIGAWNDRDAATFAGLFAQDGGLVGFDGSLVDGSAAIREELAGIFAGHPTAPYTVIVRSVHSLGDGVGLLRAVAGMVPPGQSDINPAVNAIQTLLATREDGQWRVRLFQTTPAQFHGRPELVERLTAELRRARAAAPGGE